MKQLIIFVSIQLLTFVGLHYYYNYKSPVVLINSGMSAAQKGSFIISDFAYHFIVTTRAMKDGSHRIPVDPYERGTQLHALQLQFPDHNLRTMPIGWSPLGLLMLSVLSPLSLASAQAVFISLGLTALITAVVGVTPARKELSPSRSQTLLLGILLIGSFTSNVGISAIQLGQTSILALAGFAFILLDLSAGKDCRWAWDTLGLLCLSFKLPFLILGALYLLAVRRYEGLLLAACFHLLGMAIYLSFFGIASLTHYIQVLWAYKSLAMASDYAWSLDYSRITTACAVAGSPSNFACQVLSPLLLLPLIASAGLVIFRGRRSIPPSESSAARCFIIGLSGVLMFSAYLGRYEDLLLAAALIPNFARRMTEKAIFLTMIAVLCLFLSLHFGVYTLSLTSIRMAFILKAVFLILAAAISLLSCRTDASASR